MYDKYIHIKCVYAIENNPIQVEFCANNYESYSNYFLVN